MSFKHTNGDVQVIAASKRRPPRLIDVIGTIRFQSLGHSSEKRKESFASTFKLISNVFTPTPKASK